MNSQSILIGRYNLPNVSLKDLAAETKRAFRMLWEVNFQSSDTGTEIRVSISNGFNEDEVTELRKQINSWLSAKGVATWIQE